MVRGKKDGRVGKTRERSDMPGLMTHISGKLHRVAAGGRSAGLMIPLPLKPDSRGSGIGSGLGTDTPAKLVLSDGPRLISLLHPLFSPR